MYFITIKTKYMYAYKNIAEAGRKPNCVGWSRKTVRIVLWGYGVSTFELQNSKRICVILSHQIVVFVTEATGN